jgi:hypothetical protein
MQKNHDNEYWLLEQWGLWSRGSRIQPKGYGAMEHSVYRDRWEISDDAAMAVDATLTAMEDCYQRAIKRYYVNLDYDVNQDILHIAVQEFAIAHGLAEREEFEPTKAPEKPRRTTARRTPGAHLHPTFWRKMRERRAPRPVISLQSIAG